MVARSLAWQLRSQGLKDVYPFERFTERAKKVLTLAQEEEKGPITATWARSTFCTGCCESVMG